MSSAEYKTDDPLAPAAGPRIIARLDRLPRSVVAYAATGIVGLGLFTIFSFIVFSGFLIVSAILAQFSPRTRDRALEEVSP